MGRKCDLTQLEKDVIISKLSEGKSTLEISKSIGRYHNTVKRFLEDPTKKRGRADKGHSRLFSRRSLSKLKREAMNNPGLSSAQIFNNVGDVFPSRSTRCRLLRKFAKSVKIKRGPPLTAAHKQMRLKWAKDNLKVDFSKVIFTDETRATLDGPDGWSKGWILHGQKYHQGLRRQQGGGGIMLWAGIIGDKVLGPWRIPEGTKITSNVYINFLKKNFEPWLKRQLINRKKKITFMQDNAPAHRAHMTKDYLKKLGFCGPRIMDWPSNSPDLNPIENLWSIIKRGVYRNGRQYKRKEDLWQEIVRVTGKILPAEIQKLTSSMDNRLCQILSVQGSHIPY